MTDIDDTPPATPLAKEIHEQFWRKMAKGGRADQILNGHEPPVPRPPLSDEEIERIKLNIEIQLREYAEAINAAVSWWQTWKARRPRLFRAKRPA